MRALLTITLVFTASLIIAAQEKTVPKDSLRVSLPGCAHGRNFIVMRRETPEPTNANVEPGRRFRLNGQKKLLEEIARQKGSMVLVTGLIRKSDEKQTGVGVAGGRIRIGGGQPQAPMGGGSIGRDPMYDVPQFDVESWLSLPDACQAN